MQLAEPWTPPYRPRCYFSELRGLRTHGLGLSPGFIQLQLTEILAKKTQVTGARTGKAAGQGEDTLFVWALNLTWPKVSPSRMCAGPRSTPLLGPRSHLYPEPIWNMRWVRDMGIFMGQGSGRSWAWWGGLWKEWRGFGSHDVTHVPQSRGGGPAAGRAAMGAGRPGQADGARVPSQAPSSPSVLAPALAAWS